MIDGIKIGYIGAGSMNWAWAVMGDLTLDNEIGGEVKLYDLDFASAKANEKIGNNLDSNWKYTACPSLQEALAGVDFVIISILPGTFDAMESDVHAPEAYGIYQSVGDTVGPAGIVRTMRTVPMMAEIAEAIRDYCPGAWVINYTNPMAACVNTLYRVFPGVKAFGCCHEAFHIQALLAKLMETEIGEKVTKSEININFLGVNHFVWADKASYKNTDLMPRFADFAKKYAQSGYALTADDEDVTNHFRNLNKVCFDLFNQFGVIPVAGDRHLVEFMSPSYLKDVEQWGFALTPVSWRKSNQKELLEKRARILSGAEAFEVKNSGEEGTLLIKALLGLGDMITTLNLPNRGQMQGIDHGIVVETNAIIHRDAVYPVCAGKLTEPVHAMVKKHADAQAQLIDACLNKDTSAVFEIFARDNLVCDLDEKDARELFKRMITNTKSYLKGWKVDEF
ncbi:MAG: alpha-glucosidase/alpha-galactosidase [Defluviitaleaceae bacterium]|nr:alpha-glucosidase/alpha-galactosidase [Defluviitaleaceae bacterium]